MWNCGAVRQTFQSVVAAPGQATDLSECRNRKRQAGKPVVRGANIKSKKTYFPIKKVATYPLRLIRMFDRGSGVRAVSFKE